MVNKNDKNKSEYNLKQLSFKGLTSGKEEVVIDENKIICCNFAELAEKKVEEEILKKFLEHDKNLGW